MGVGVGMDVGVDLSLDLGLGLGLDLGLGLILRMGSSGPRHWRSEWRLRVDSEWSQS